MNFATKVSCFNSCWFTQDYSDCFAGASCRISHRQFCKKSSSHHFYGRHSRQDASRAIQSISCNPSRNAENISSLPKCAIFCCWLLRLMLWLIFAPQILCHPLQYTLQMICVGFWIIVLCLLQISFQCTAHLHAAASGQKWLLLFFNHDQEI